MSDSVGIETSVIDMAAAMRESSYATWARRDHAARGMVDRVLLFTIMHSHPGRAGNLALLVCGASLIGTAILMVAMIGL